GPTERLTSPPSAGFSILITSAPRSPSIMLPNGPAPYCSTAMTRRPESGSMGQRPKVGGMPFDLAFGRDEAYPLRRHLEPKGDSIAMQRLQGKTALITGAARGL